VGSTDQQDMAIERPLQWSECSNLHVHVQWTKCMNNQVHRALPRKKEKGKKGKERKL